jgi:gliding motility-associated-like protein
VFNGDGNPNLSWPGDDDLDELLVENNPFDDNGTHNATALEFDFVPLINKFEFEFLFAAEEYGQSQCSFHDAFAFILTDEDGNSQNLAVIPNTSIPVSVGTIRDAQFNAGCSSENVDYFGQYSYNQPLAAAINFRGQTVPMKASAIVVPGQTYHIKLVIADYSDFVYNSAVFLGGGTFDVGTVDLGPDLLVADGTALCDTETKVLDSQLSGDQYNFTWFKDGVAIPGATESTYEVTEAGVYGIDAAYQDIDCSFEGTIRIEYYPLVNTLTGDPLDMTVCDASGFHSFDLTPNVDALLALPADPANFAVSIHLSEADAQTGDNPIDPADYTDFTNTVEDLQTLWTRTVYSVTTCIGIKPFDLIVQDLTPVYTIDSDFSICEGTSDTIDVVITDTDPNPVTYTWTKDGAPLPDTTPSITVTEAGAYTVVLDRTGCTATSTVNVTVTPTPVADDPADVISCNSYVLPALSANNAYFSTADGSPIAVGTIIEDTTDIIVRAESATTPNCMSADNVFTVTITDSILLVSPGDQAACDSYVLPALTAGNYFTATGGTGTALNAGDVIDATQTIYIYANNALAPNCSSEVSFEVTINTSPVADAPANVEACDSYVLPALTLGNTYWTGSNGTGLQLAEGSEVNESMEIFVFAQTNTTPVCTDENSFTVTINPTPVFNLGGPYVACSASNVTITVSGTNFADADAIYAWTFEGTPVSGGSSITASGFGTYELTVTVKNCSHTESIEVTHDTDVIALLFIDGCEDGQYMLSVTDDNGSFDIDSAAYAWTGPNGFTSDKREFVVTTAGEYFVTVTTAEGCVGEDSFIVTDTGCDIQRGISPNNDGLNDAFDLSQLDVKYLSIFNRYGQEVYSKNNYKKEWTGQSNNGQELPTGTYYYMIEFASGEQKTGWIYINRQD